jgi:transposase
VFSERMSAALKVHSRSVAAAAFTSATGERLRPFRPRSHEHIRGWLKALPGPVGRRTLGGSNAKRIRCVVAAPLKLKRPRVAVKTDAKDAVHLARLLRLDEVTPLVVPSVEQRDRRQHQLHRDQCRGFRLRELLDNRQGPVGHGKYGGHAARTNEARSSRPATRCWRVVRGESWSRP